MNFESGICSRSSFPTKATVRVSEIDSARHMDELKSSSSILGTIAPRLGDRGLQQASLLERAEGTTGQSIPERKTKCLMIHDNFKISGTCEALLDVNRSTVCTFVEWHVQGFDTRSDEVLVSMTKIPDGDVLEKLAQETPPFLRGVETPSWLCICRI